VSAQLASTVTEPTPSPRAPGPAALADPDDVEALLTGVGFEAVEFTSFDEPLWFGADADAAYAFVGAIGLVRGLSEVLTTSPERMRTRS